MRFSGRLLSLALAAFVGCNSADTDLSKRKIKVVCTTGMISDLVKNIGGERVDVFGLMGPGVDPHKYVATERDRGRMESADVIFYNGLHLEGKMGDVLDGMSSTVKTLAITAKIPRNDLRPAPEGYEGGPHDPHIWFNVKLWIRAADDVRDTLITLDPTHAEIYRTNATAYIKKLDELHAYVHGEAKKVPEKHRVLITAHDAFFYFGHEYGFKVHAVLGISSDDEASTEDIRRLTDVIVKTRAPAIFPESSVPKQSLEAVKRSVEARNFQVKFGEELFSDALGGPEDGKNADTYLGMVRYNVDAIVRALRD